MPVLYVVDVPEFQPLVDYARNAPELTVSKQANYHKIEAAGELVIHREATGMDAAIWFGGLVGGYEGKIVEFSEDVLRIG
tara:strand:+ start:238 stop:477 length:240 start_codon:yes stop_codon:yes gene_type:complete